MSRLHALKPALFLLAAATLAQAQAPVKVLYWGGATTTSHNPGALRDTLTPYFASNSVQMTYRSAAVPVWLHPDTLSQYDVLMVYTTNQNASDLTATQLNALYDWVDSGHVIVALHGSTNTFINGGNAWRGSTTVAGWRQLLGGQFTGHGASNNSGTITYAAPAHPALTGTTTLPASASADPGGSANTPFWDEGRLHNQYAPDTVVIARNQVGSVSSPWIWVRPQGQGFVYYNASGHNHRVFTRPEFKGQILQALRWGAEVGNPVVGLRGRPAVDRLIQMQGARLIVPVAGTHSVRVQDLAGRKVFQKRHSQAESHDLSRLPLGHYSIEILTRTGVYRGSFVKAP